MLFQARRQACHGGGCRRIGGKGPLSTVLDDHGALVEILPAFPALPHQAAHTRLGEGLAAAAEMGGQAASRGAYRALLKPHRRGRAAAQLNAQALGARAPLLASVFEHAASLSNDRDVVCTNSRASQDHFAWLDPTL